MVYKPLARWLGWHILETRYLYRSPWHRLRQDRIRLPDGDMITYTYQEHAGFVAIVPVTHSGELVLIRTYRYTVDDWVLEIPAGGLGNRPGQPLLQVAQEELAEEVGGVAEHWEYIDWFYTANGTTSAVGHLFLATEVTLSLPPRRENTEVMDVVRLSVREALHKARSGEMRDGESALALLRLEPRLMRMVNYARKIGR